MSGAYRNSEGYFDPTAGEAIRNVTRGERGLKGGKSYRPLVFICSPYAGDTKRHTLAARRYCRFAVGQNAIPVAPHLLFPQFLDDSDRDERGLGLFFAKVLMDRCDEVWVFADGAYSAGMRSEHERAVRKGFKIRYFTTDCREVHPDRDRREEQMEPFQGLANEIVIQAVKDYRAAGQKLKRRPDSRLAKAEIDSIEQFFRSEWYSLLTSVDGELLISRLREEVFS